MVLAQRQSWEKTYLAIAKSFLVWSFTLTVCLLVVGFPLVVLMATMAVLAAIILQSVLPMSAVLVVVGSVIGVNILSVFVGAAVLTLKGVHPEDVTWLNWLHGKNQPIHPNPTYSSCPLTCDLVKIVQ
ncbi:hypothetical protein PN462_10575 [Spirulina sp. CS-785/01]|uniref:hypothetical protein n=1 Tax=Spirulina sp. CS-785/01 TaxID=3021716 RepID=UPI00232D914B|nr:hypothetical protein [Spirulina sp. CS-785/01]MDB9313544.1 hypothetical protein [Spirulina sp. CS-785/01]